MIYVRVKRYWWVGDIDKKKLCAGSCTLNNEIIIVIINS